MEDKTAEEDVPFVGCTSQDTPYDHLGSDDFGPICFKSERRLDGEARKLGLCKGVHR